MLGTNTRRAATCLPPKHIVQHTVHIMHQIIERTVHRRREGGLFTNDVRSVESDREANAEFGEEPVGCENVADRLMMVGLVTGQRRPTSEQEQNRRFDVRAHRRERALNLCGRTVTESKYKREREGACLHLAKRGRVTYRRKNDTASLRRAAGRHQQRKTYRRDQNAANLLDA